jgi:two-component system chemotaxis sensor kinase CheA
MSDPMQEIMASFFVECEELLEALVDALQTMADGEADGETINVAFRAVHSIKGGAGAFGLELLVGFAHQFETVMDLCRSGQLATDAGLLDLFFRCSDMLSDLVRASRDGTAIDTAARDAMLAELGAHSGTDGEAAEDAVPIDFAPMAIDLDDLDAPADFDMTLPPLPDLDDLPPAADPAEDLPGEVKALLVIEFRPMPELYDSGNDPRSLLKSLASVAPCNVNVACDPVSALPEVSTLGSRLSWAITFEDPVAPNAVREVFEFVEDLCALSISAGAPMPAPATALPLSEAVPAAPAKPAPALAPPPVAKPAATAPADDSDADETAQPSATALAGAGQKPGAKPSATVRVDIERIDRLVNLVGELVINQAMLSQSITAGSTPTNSSVLVGLEEFLQLTRDIQESVMMIRAQPVKSLFQRMSRIAREASSAIGKPVRLITEGENTEIDKTAIERLADPLTHMIRNAVDHGLESPEARRAAGKPEQGEIRLSASHRSGRVLIEISDNGGGINREKVRRIAISKGLVPEDAALTDAEIDQLLFLPGFSTADKVSNLSGRGVGMDVVKTQITALGGRIAIESAPGVGSTFSISLPLTLAVLDGMVVSVAGETLVVPLGSIVETLSLTPGDLSPVSPGQNVVRVRDRFVPVLDLGTELGYRPPRTPDKSGIALLISPEEGRLVALLVDTIDDQRQVVIKGLQESYGHVPGVAAATILGDGQIALILDPTDLVQNASLPDTSPETNRKAS